MEKFEFNQDWKLRDNMLDVRPGFGSRDNYDVLLFDNMGADTLQKMVDLRFADPNERQNNSPTIQEFIEFLNDNPNFTAFGYVVSINRDDYRLSVEGVESFVYDPRQFANFVNKFRMADEFTATENYQRAWYD